MANITTFPVETVDDIVFHVEATQDLLSLALTCKFFADVVCPRHIQFRLIRCDVLETIELWSQLAKDRSLARNVRTLEIGSGWRGRRYYSPRIPSNVKLLRGTVTFLNDRDGRAAARKAEGMLIAAIKNMTELISFKWLTTTGLPVIDSRRKDSGGEDIWTALKQLPVVRHLDVVDVYTGTASHYKPIHDSMIWIVSNLTSFIYESSAHNGTDDELDMSGLTIMLGKHCPDLQFLQLEFCLEPDYDTPALKFGRLDELFALYQWPYLHTLRLVGVHCTPATAVRFFAVHPAIEELRMDEMFGADEEVIQEGEQALPPQFAPGTLPNLRILECNIYQANSILSAPSLALRPIEYISGISLMDHVYRDRFLELLVDIPTLRRLDLDWSDGPEDVIQLSRVTNSLTWLEVGENNVLAPGPTKHLITHWIDAITHFPDLAAFHNAKLLFEEDPNGRASIVATLSSRCPNLRRIDKWGHSTSGGHGFKADEFVALSRDEVGTPSWKIVPQDNWGGW